MTTLMPNYLGLLSLILVSTLKTHSHTDSVEKSFTASAVIQPVEAGKIEADQQGVG